MNTIMLNSRDDLTQATIKIFGAFAPDIPLVIHDYMATFVFGYRYKGFAIREIEDGHCYYLPLHIERISMITPIDYNLLDVSPDALGILLTLHCYSLCLNGNINQARAYALEHMDAMKQKRKYLFDYALRTLPSECLVMMLK